MPRKRSKPIAEHMEQQTETTTVDAPPESEPLDAAPATGQATQEAVERSERPSPKLRGVAVEIIGNKRVRLIDNGNAGGVGIKIEGLAEGEKVSDEVKGILRENDGVRLIYRNDMDKSWMTRVDPMNPSGTRRAVEKKFAAVVEQMRKEAEHEAPPLP